MKKILAAAAVLLATGLAVAPPASADLPNEIGLRQTNSCKVTGQVTSSTFTVTYDRNPNNGKVILRKIKFSPGVGPLPIAKGQILTTNQGSYDLGANEFNVTGTWVDSFSWYGKTRVFVCTTGNKTVS